MMPPQRGTRLLGIDYALLALLCLVLFGFALVDNRRLTTHEAIHCENVREMLADGSWIIPTCGGRPWLERPPLPHWLTAVFVWASGHAEQEWPYRIGPAVAGATIVFLIAWMAGVLYGRTIGVLSGAILATMREFTSYAVGPECDIFLSAVVALAMILFFRVEFLVEPHENSPRIAFLGHRSWVLLGFFIVLGLTNLAKGLIFGTLQVLIPIGGYLLWNMNLQGIRRYIWLWGWVAFLAAALAWPLAVYRLYPDILDLWFSDYIGRLNQGYMREPAWYYLAQLPWVLFPWSIAALVGLWSTRGKPAPAAGSPERFLWCWAILPIAFFSIPQGKHHHYLLPCMAPWAVLSAIGAVRVWRLQVQAPRWLRRPAVVAIFLGMAGDAILWTIRHRLPGDQNLLPGLLAGWPLSVFAFWWALVQPRFRLAFGVLLSLLCGMHCLAESYYTHFMDRYREDMAFVEAVRTVVTAGTTIHVLNDSHPLNSSWFLFYLGEQAHHLHNATFLLDEQIKDTEVYVVGRGRDEATLTRYGVTTVVAQSQHTRGEATPADRWTLFRLNYHPDLPRKSAAVRISPMQATGRSLGPYLEQVP